jgi:glycosyltransferase involved in cell wall biosynthesis
MMRTDGPIRIAFVLHVMQVAGAEMLVAGIIRRLAPTLDPVVLCLDDLGQLGERMQHEGVPVVVLGRRPGLDWSTSGRLAAELQRRTIEVVHAHQYTPFFYSALAKLRLRRRCHLMFTEHGRHYPDLVSSRRRLANRAVLARMADEVTGVCQFSARQLAVADGFSRRPIEIIENGIDVHDEPRPDDARGLVRARFGLAANQRYIVCVARFHPVKDHAMLLRAFARVAAERHDVELLLAGDGPLRPALEQDVRARGLTSRVRFLGVCDDVPALLRAADVFTLTSVSEAASLTLLEAMEARLPVVVTNVGGNPEIVRSGIDGLLVPRGDAAQTAQALLDLLDAPDMARRMGESGHRRVRERYNLTNTIASYGARYAAAAAELRAHPSCS